MFAMPSEIMDLPGLSRSSFFSEEVHFPSEVGLWKTESRADHFGLKLDGISQTAGGNSVASSPLEKRIPVSSQMAESFDHPDAYLISLEKHVGGAERTFSHSLPRHLDYDSSRRSNLNAELTSYMVEGEKLDVGGQHENGLFSSSLSELFTRKLRLLSNNAVYGHSVGAAAFQYEEEEPLESIEEIEAQTIRNLLPDDDDLFSGVTDGLDCMGRPLGGDDTEDLDLFSSVGGMDLGEDNSSLGQRNSEFLGGNTNGQLGGGGSIAGEHPFGEHPSRTLFVRNINSNVEDSELRALFEQYGDIRTLYTACKHRCFVMISYYDIRAARNAMKALQNKLLQHRKLDIHFSIPKDNPSDKDINQGTLVVYNLDSSVSNDELRQIFGVYGEIKEVRETSHRSHHKFVEFYDVRAAESALCALNRSDIAGKTIKIEPSCPGGARRSTQPFAPQTELDDTGAYVQQGSPTNNLTTTFSGPILHGGVTSCSGDNGIIFGANSATRAPISPFVENMFHQNTSSSIPSSLPSLLRMESFGNQSNATESGHSQGQPKLEFMGSPNFHPHSLPEYHENFSSGAPFNSLVNLPSAAYSVRPPERTESWQFCRLGSNGNSIELNEVFGPAGNGSCPPPGHHYVWSNSHHSQPQGIMWPNSPSFVKSICSTPPHTRTHAVPRAPSNMLNTLLPVSNHHVGSAPSVNPSIWDRRHAYAGESPDASVFHPASLGNMRISGNSPHPLEFVPPNIIPNVGGNCMDIPIASKNLGLHSHNQRCVMFPARSQMIPMMNSFDSPNERNRIRRNEGSSNQDDNKKQFELDIDRIMRGEDNRTTLMIKNIPNKYTSKMLLAAIDERHRGTYDFIYLPIDFKNKCNVGYAFVNMTDPSLIIPFYQAFNGKKWEKFNSEKVASLAYARIQGKAALIAHFQNSSLMNEDKRCRPILFHTDGPNAGDQVPFPMGVNVRTRSGKNLASATEENHLDSPANSANGEECSNGDSSSGSARESE